MTTTQDQKKPSSFDMITGMISRNVSALLGEPANRIYDFIRVFAVSYGYGLAGAVCIGIVGLLLGIVFALTAGTFNLYDLMPYAAANQTHTLMFVALFGLAAIPILFVSSWYAYSASLTSYLVPSHQNEGKRIPVVNEGRMLRNRALPLFIIDALLGVFIAAMVAAAYVFFFVNLIQTALLKGGAGSGQAIGAILTVYIGVILGVMFLAIMGIVYAFFTQFWKMNVILGKRGWYDGLAHSISMVKNNLGKVLLFDILLVLLSLAVGMALGILSLIILVPLQLGSFAALFVSPPLYLAVVAITSILRIVLYFITSAVASAFTTPSKVEFWKSLNDEPIEGNATRK